jgi:hypothetical protein
MEVAKQSTGPSKGYKIKLYDTNMTELEGGFNDLIKEESGEVILGLSIILMERRASLLNAQVHFIS